MSVYVISLPALRDVSVGTDTFYYVKFFKNPRGGYDGEEIDFGYSLWVSFLRFFTDSSELYLFLNCLVSLGGVVYFIRKNSYFPILSLLLFILLGSMYNLQFAGMRQSMAIGIFLYSVNLLINSKKEKKALVVYIIACSMHATAIVMLPFYFLLKKIKFRKKVCYIVLIISFFIGLLGLFDFRMIIDVVLSNIGIESLERYSNYGAFMTDYQLTSHRLIMNLIPYSLLMFFLIKRSNNINDLYFKFAFTGVVLSNILVSFPIGFRLLMYFLIFLIIVIPKTFNRKTELDIGMVSFIILYYSYKGYAELVAQLSTDFVGNIIVPYSTFFNN